VRQHTYSPSFLHSESVPGNPSEQVLAFSDPFGANQPYGGLLRRKGLSADGRVHFFRQDRVDDDLVVKVAFER
jgi:hypothetical protein